MLSLISLCALFAPSFAAVTPGRQFNLAYSETSTATLSLASPLQYVAGPRPVFPPALDAESYSCGPLEYPAPHEYQKACSLSLVTQSPTGIALFMDVPCRDSQVEEALPKMSAKLYRASDPTTVVSSTSIELPTLYCGQNAADWFEAFSAEATQAWYAYEHVTGAARVTSAPEANVHEVSCVARTTGVGANNEGGLECEILLGVVSELSAEAQEGLVADGDDGVCDDVLVELAIESTSSGKSSTMLGMQACRALCGDVASEDGVATSFGCKESLRGQANTYPTACCAQSSFDYDVCRHVESGDRDDCPFSFSLFRGDGSSDEDSGITGAAIVAIVAGVIFALCMCCVAVLTCLFVARRRQASAAAAPPKATHRATRSNTRSHSRRPSRTASTPRVNTRTY